MIICVLSVTLKISEFVWEYLRPLLGSKNNVKFSMKNASPYFHSASLVVWTLTLLKRDHYSELSISKFPTPARKQGRTLFSNTRPEKRKIHAQNDWAASNPTQNPAKCTVVSFQFSTNLIIPVEPTTSRSLLPKFLLYTFLTTRVHIHHDMRSLKPARLMPTDGVVSYFLRAVVNICIQTLSFSSWRLLRCLWAQRQWCELIMSLKPQGPHRVHWTQGTRHEMLF